MVQDIFIIDENNKLKEQLIKLFDKENEYRFKQLNTENLDVALKSIPSLIIINEDSISIDIFKLMKIIKENDDNAITPIIVISSNCDKQHRINVLKEKVEYYIKSPVDEEYIYYTVKNIITLLNSNRKISPLTGLAGNVQIQAEMKKRLLNNEHFVMLYLDLDNFKAYNDVYGFVKGDEIIKFTAQIILENLHKYDYENSFLGHIGGDDFVAIVSNIDYENLCQDIILDFDKKVIKFFYEEHIKNGGIYVENRKGILEQYPLTSISIGVVEVDPGRFKNILEIGEVGAQVKHLSKTVQGSTYVIDKRKK